MPSSILPRFGVTSLIASPRLSSGRPNLTSARRVPTDAPGDRDGVSAAELDSGAAAAAAAAAAAGASAAPLDARWRPAGDRVLSLL